MRLPAEAPQIPVARRAVARYCLDGGMAAELVDDVKLVVTEAVTNVVLHAYDAESSVERAFDLRALFAADELLVSVVDQGRGRAAAPASPGLGLGLRIAREMATGMRTPATESGTGTSVELRFRLVV
jgi:serine/threonine-protein kinase RsbW